MRIISNDNFRAALLTQPQAHLVFVVVRRRHFYRPVQDNLRWGCDRKTADRICNFNRHYAEHSGYFEKTNFLDEATKAPEGTINFYDSNTGKLLFTAPKGRTMEEFLLETRRHGWPSFRDEGELCLEVVS
jgi:hypothetical protein